MNSSSIMNEIADRAKIMNNMKTLVYVGFRKRMIDPLYGTGEWGQEEGENIKKVPADIAKKMLVHTDVWRETDMPKAPEKAEETSVKVDDEGNVIDKSIPVVEPPPPSTDENEAEESQRVRDSIAAMDTKQAIADFISANYSGIKLDKRSSLDAMKQEAIGVVDRFGVTP